MKISADAGWYKFLLILECVSPEACLPVDQEPETETDYVDIILAYSISELTDFFEVILPVEYEDGKTYRGFTTINIDEYNISAFIDAISELGEYWAEVDRDLDQKEDFNKKIKGKNFVQGNGTIN